MGLLKRSSIAAVVAKQDEPPAEPGTPAFTEGLIGAFGSAATKAVETARARGIPVAGRDGEGHAAERRVSGSVRPVKSTSGGLRPEGQRAAAPAAETAGSRPAGRKPGKHRRAKQR